MTSFCSMVMGLDAVIRRELVSQHAVPEHADLPCNNGIPSRLLLIISTFRPQLHTATIRQESTLSRTPLQLLLLLSRRRRITIEACAVIYDALRCERVRALTRVTQAHNQRPAPRHRILLRRISLTRGRHHKGACHRDSPSCRFRTTDSLSQTRCRSSRQCNRGSRMDAYWVHSSWLSSRSTR